MKYPVAPLGGSQSFSRVDFLFLKYNTIDLLVER